MRNYLLVMLVAGLLSGCGSLSQSLVSQKTAKLIQKSLEESEMITLPAQLRVMHIKYVKDGYIVCAEPMPDIALSDTFKMLSSIAPDAKIKLENDLQTSTTAIALEGRTQLVLLARDFLYRTCEFTFNGWIKAEDVKEIHQQILTHITMLIETDKKNAETAAVLARSVAAGKLDPNILENVGMAVRAAEKNSCVKTYQGCIKKPGADKNAKDACSSELNKCLP